MSTRAGQPPLAATEDTYATRVSSTNLQPRGGAWAAPVALAVLTLVGALLRVGVARQSLFADELSTYWVVTAHDLRGVVSVVHTDAEITPPLTFVLTWLTTQLGHASLLVRAPSVVAGIATIPLVYRLGLRTVGRPAALAAAALTTFGPFMVYYSAEARAYGVMMALTVGSTLAMLAAVDTRRTRWWVVYALCSCAAVYTHYTCVFVLATQLAWLLWAHPEARRAALIANGAAVALFAPWASGFLNDLRSPTSGILSALSPFTLHSIRISLEHWTVGYPYANLPLRGVPGIPALLLLLVALAVTAAVGGPRAARGLRRPGWWARLDRRIVLVVALTLAAPVGESLVGAVGTNLFSVRNLAVSWPALALSVAAAFMATGARLRWLTAACAVVALAIGAVKLQLNRYPRPDYQSATHFVDRQARPGDVVLDETGILSPGPLTPFDVSAERPHQVFRAGSPAERDHPFGLFDFVVDRKQAIPQLIAAARGNRVYVVANVKPRPGHVPTVAELEPVAIPGYRRIEARVFPAFAGGVQVQVYGKGPGA